MKTLTTLLAILFSISLSAQSTFQSYFGQGNPFTEGYDIIATSDGGFLVTGTAMNANFNNDLYIIKINQDGEAEWTVQKDYDGGILSDIAISAAENDEMFSILGYSLIDGVSTPGCFLININKDDGDIQSFFNLADLLPFGSFTHVISDNNGKLYLLGYYDPMYDGSIKVPLTLLQMDSKSFEIDWVKSYENSLSGSMVDYYYSGLHLSSNKEIFIGAGGANPDSISINIQSKKLVVSKTDSLGNQIWLNEIPDTRMATDIALTSSSVIATSDFNFSGEKGLLFSFDRATGDLEWQKSYEPYLETVAGCVANTADEIMCSGNKEGDFVLIKVDKNGNLIWSKTTEPPSNIKSLQSRSVALSTDEGIVVTGSLLLDGIPGPSGIFIYRLNSDGEFGDIVSTQNNISLHDFDIDVFPNPTTDIVTIKNKATVSEAYQLTLYDLKGVKQHQTTLLNQSMKINMLDYPNGAYILEIRTTDNQILHKTIVKE